MQAHQGDNIVITAKKPTWDDFFNQTSAFGSDFLAEREDDLPQERGKYPLLPALLIPVNFAND